MGHPLSYRAGSVVDATHYGYDPTGETSSTGAVQAAIGVAADTGGAVVFIPDGTLRLDRPLTPRNRVTVTCNPGGVVVVSPNNIHAFTDPGEDIDHFTVENLEFEGTRPDPGVYPTRGPSGIGSIPDGLRSAGLIRGAHDPAGRHRIGDITYRNVRAYDMGSLPIHISGADAATMTGCRFHNTLDPSYTYTHNVTHIGNTITGGGDNGVSVSRGCRNITVTGNTSTGCAYYGFWVAGYVNRALGIGDPGPQTFTITGNIAANCGQGGLGLRDAPMWGTVTGNTFDTMRRGPLDAPDNSQGNGVHITGYPYTPLPNPSLLATGITITGNTFRGCERGGISIRGAQYIKISGNHFLDVGSEAMLNGSSVPADDQNYNCGVYCSDPASTSHIVVDGNTFSDTRGVPVSNYAVSPNLTKIPTVVVQGNTGFNLRQPVA